MLRRTVSIAAALLLGAAFSAHADTYTYTYVGPKFTNFDPPTVPGSDHVVVTFTTSAPLAPNQSYFSPASAGVISSNVTVVGPRGIISGGFNLRFVPTGFEVHTNATASATTSGIDAWEFFGEDNSTFAGTDFQAYTMNTMATGAWGGVTGSYAMDQATEVASVWIYGAHINPSNTSPANWTLVVNGTTPPPDVLSNPTLTLTTATTRVPVTGVVATFSDSNTSAIASDFTASINWGDGTVTAGAVNGSSGTFSISAPLNGHTYATQGSFTVAATLTENAPATATSTATGRVVVANPVSPPPACSANYQGLWWAAGGTEPGWGISLAQSGDEIFALWSTYDTGTVPYWMSMRCQPTPGCKCTGPLYAGTAPVGTGILTFSDVDNGTFAYNLDAGAGGSTGPVSQTKTIVRFDLATGAQVTCTYDPAADLALATNYQDLWWTGEPGWGVVLAHQGDSVFLTWATSDSGGSPLWLSSLAQRVGTSNVYQGPMQLTSGPRFDAYNANDLVHPIPTVGTATLTFADGNNATFNFTSEGTDALPELNQTKSITRFPFAPGGTICR